METVIVEQADGTLKAETRKEKNHQEILEKAKVEHSSAESTRRVTLRVHQLYIEKLGDSHQAQAAAQIRSMGLDAISEDEVAYTVIKIDETRAKGDSYAALGQTVFFMQAVTAALVPVLIGIMGSFSESVDNILRIVSITLSIIGTIAKALQEVYVFRPRGQAISERCSAMNDLFHRYVALAGPIFEPRGDKTHPLYYTPDNPHQAMFQTYIDEFNQELAEMRMDDAAMLGAAQPGGSSPPPKKEHKSDHDSTEAQAPAK